MQSPLLSLHSIFDALDLDVVYIPLFEQSPTHADLISANTPETVYNAIQEIGNTLNASQKANQLVENLEERINIISHKLKFILEENKPNVLFLNDVSPAKTIYNEYLGNMVQVAGGRIQPGTRDNQVGNPDILIIVNDKPIPQLLNELPNALSTPDWSQTAAISNGNVYIIRHSGFLRQPGATIADDAEILAEIINPKYFVFGRDEDAWMKFEWQ
ncbi:ABC transporter substrate-binding protein [Parapedobacter pyrenivorans]|nr:ABC transporter substrate-binding protein [Parapedobacter pyrenivorans]